MTTGIPTPDHTHRTVTPGRREAAISGAHTTLAAGGDIAWVPEVSALPRRARG